MAGRYELNPSWISHPRWTPAARLTLRATVTHDGEVDVPRVRHAVNEWLQTLQPAWITIDGAPSLVAYQGGAWVDLAFSYEASAICPDVLISSAGEEAPDWIADVADSLYDAIIEFLPAAQFSWREEEPRPFDRA